MGDQAYSEAFRDAIHRNIAMISDSAVFVNLYSKDMGKFEEDPLPAIQLAIAILLDKPILLLAIDGREPPARLRRAADSIVRAATVQEAMPEIEREIARLTDGA